MYYFIASDAAEKCHDIHCSVIDADDMDTLTHALSGALLARATEPKNPRPDQLPRRARMWVGFWVAAFPDSDFITRFIDPLTYLTVHRGVTHSVIMLPLWALGIGIHIAGDVITAFGTMIFAPFSDWRAQFPATFIIDPYFTAIIVGGLVASTIWRATRKPDVTGLAVLACYIGFQAILHQRAIAVGEAYAARHDLDVSQVEAIPQPFSPFNWMIVLPQKDAYYMTYVSLWRREIPEFPPADANWLMHVNASYFPTTDAIWKRIARFGSGNEVNLAERVWFSEALAPYRRFALFPALYRVDHKKDGLCVWFNDLRFALAGRIMPFRYGACRNGTDAAWRVYRLFNDGNGQEIFDAIPH